MKLNSNQIIHRVQPVARAMQSAIAGLVKDDQRAILKQALESVCPELLQEAALTTHVSSDDMQAMILNAIKSGLESNDAQMVRAAMNWQQEQAGREYLKELTVNIVPYRVKDTSLERIVLDADEIIVQQVEAALQKRRAVPAAASNA